MNQCPNTASCENWSEEQGCVVMSTNDILRNDAQSIADDPPTLFGRFFEDRYTTIYDRVRKDMRNKRFNLEVVGGICRKMLDSGEPVQQIADGMLNEYEHDIRKVKKEFSDDSVA